MSSIGDDASDANTYQIIDMNKINLFFAPDDEDRAALFDIFFAQVDQDLKVLADNVVDMDQDIWAKSMHRIRGSALNLGASGLIALCNEANALSTLSEEHRKAIVIQIKSELKKIEAFVETI